MRSAELDNLEIRILEILQRDATIPLAALAEKLHSSKSVVWRRLQRMLDSGVIRERVAIVDPRKVGFNVLIFVRVRMGAHDRDLLPKFMEKVKTFPQVLECHALLGDVDFLLKVVARDLDDYDQFFSKKLSRIEGVREIISSIAIGQFITTTRLPLRE